MAEHAKEEQRKQQAREKQEELIRTHEELAKAEYWNQLDKERQELFLKSQRREKEEKYEQDEIYNGSEIPFRASTKTSRGSLRGNKKKKQEKERQEEILSLISWQNLKENQVGTGKDQSKKISNDQELIQSDPISCPQNQKGNN